MGADQADCRRQVSSQNRTRHGRFGKDAWLALRQKQGPNVRAQGSILPRFPSGAATPASIVDALKAAAGLRPGTRASFAKGRCVRGTYVPSDQAREITKSRSFTKPSRVLARFSVDGGNPMAANTTSCCAASASGSATMTTARTFSRKALRFILRGRSTRCWRSSQARIPGPDGKPDLGEGQGILRRQSRNAASGKLHRCASAAREFCRHDLLGRALLSRDECKGRDALHQVQDRCRSAGTSRGPRMRPRRSLPTSCTTISKAGSPQAISVSA